MNFSHNLQLNIDGKPVDLAPNLTTRLLILLSTWLFLTTLLASGTPAFNLVAWFVVSAFALVMIFFFLLVVAAVITVAKTSHGSLTWGPKDSQGPLEPPLS